MSIGVIRKWGPEDIDRYKHPTLREFAEKFRQPEVRLRDLNRTPGPMGNNGNSQRCPTCGGGGDDWGSLRPDTGPPKPTKDNMEDQSIGLWGEPMDLSFRLLKDSARPLPKDSLTDEEAANAIDGADEETCPTCGGDLSDVFEGHPNEGNSQRKLGGHSDMGIPDYEPPPKMPRKLPTGVKVGENPPREKIKFSGRTALPRHPGDKRRKKENKPDDAGPSQRGVDSAVTEEMRDFLGLSHKYKW